MLISQKKSLSQVLKQNEHFTLCSTSPNFFFQSQILIFRHMKLSFYNEVHLHQGKKSMPSLTRHLSTCP